MGYDAVEIRELVLRIPGIGRGQARDLGNEVARRLSEELPTWPLRRHAGAIDLRIAIPAGTPHEQLPRVIAEQIARALR
jgi:hypothetical protein